jgi:hypothetical protein
MTSLFFFAGVVLAYALAVLTAKIEGEDYDG